MKKTAAFLLVLILSVTFACGPNTSVVKEASVVASPAASASPTETPSYDFRKTQWGMSREEVSKTENGNIIDQDEQWLVYHSDDIAGMSATIGYKFDNDSLVLGMYMFENSHTNENDYIDDYENLKTALTSLYGDPVVDNVGWDNDLYKDDPQMYGFAVSCGHLAYIATWETETTDISLVLSGDNYEISLNAAYESKGYEAPTNDNGL